MNFLTYISLKNFRGFQDSGNIRLAPLTFLVGPNSSGKSTIGNAVMFVAQSFNPRSVTNLTTDWMGRVTDLGSFSDTVYKHNVKNSISIEIGLRIATYSEIKKNVEKPQHETIWKWEIKNAPASTNNANFSSGRVTSSSVIDKTSGASLTINMAPSHVAILLNGTEARGKTGEQRTINSWIVQSYLQRYLQNNNKNLNASMAGYRRVEAAYSSHAVARFFSNLERVTSARSGPKRWVAKGALPSNETPSLGLLNDPYAMDLNASSSRSLRKNPNNREPIAKYLKELGIASTLERVDLSAYHSALQITDSVSNIRSNLADVGFGASQVIPVIRGCLNNNESPLVIEQPEIHLHPKAQGQLAALICETAKYRQIFVETHSEHMINRARIMVAEGELEPDDVIILYVDRTSKGSSVVEIGINPNGDFTKEWPSGFFDERYKDAMTLLKLKSTNSEVIRTHEKDTNRAKRARKTQEAGGEK
jgi:predicted ATPase